MKKQPQTLFLQLFESNSIHAFRIRKLAIRLQVVVSFDTVEESESQTWIKESTLYSLLIHNEL